MTIACSPICLNAAYEPSANPALTGTPLTVTARSVRGMPTRYTPPACTWPALPSACSTVFQSGSVARESPGIAAATTTSNTIARFNRCDFMICVSFVHFAYHAYRRSLVELLGHGLPVGALEQGDLGDGMGILHRRHDTDRAVPRVGFHGVGRRGRERPLRFR